MFPEPPVNVTTVSEPSVAVLETKPAPILIVAFAVLYLIITTPESPGSFPPLLPGEPPPPVFVP